MGSNYPPGVTAGHPYFNPPDHSHEHHWMPEVNAPIFEDGAAIFHEECEYAEGEWGEGWQCEETRTYRFEASYIWYPNGQGGPIPHISDGEMPERMELGFANAERDANNMNADHIDVDPHPEDGEVRVENDGWTVVYKP